MFKLIRLGLFAAVLVCLPATAGAQRNDSLWNGAVVGAAAGAVLGATVVAGRISDCSECSGFNVPLTFAVIGAGAGVAIGVGIDALLHADPRVGRPRDRSRRVNVSPVVGKRTRALVAS